MRVLNCVDICVWMCVCVDLCGYGWTCVDVRVDALASADVCGSAWKCVNVYVYAYVDVCADVCGCVLHGRVLMCVDECG